MYLAAELYQTCTVSPGKNKRGGVTRWLCVCQQPLRLPTLHQDVIRKSNLPPVNITGQESLLLMSLQD